MRLVDDKDRAPPKQGVKEGRLPQEPSVGDVPYPRDAGAVRRCEPHRVPHERRVGHLPRHAIGERGRRHPPGLRAHHLTPAVGPAVLVQVLRQLGRFAAPGLPHEHDHAARLEGVQDPGAVGEDGECPTLGGVVAVGDVDGGGGGGSSGGTGADGRCGFRRDRRLGHGVEKAEKK